MIYELTICIGTFLGQPQCDRKFFAEIEQCEAGKARVIDWASRQIIPRDTLIIMCVPNSEYERPLRDWMKR